MKLVLLGYMGCGKSAISKALSKDLQLKRIDLDDYIEEKAGKKIKEIFAESGEIHFRKLEIQYLKEVLASEEDFILSLGGGTPCFGSNMELVNESATSIYLKASIPTLVGRLSGEKSERPLIAHLQTEELTEFIGKHLYERGFYYLQANHIAKVDDKSVLEIVDDIKKAVM